MPASRGGEREGLADNCLNDFAAADALRADAADDRAFPLLHADPLQVGAEGAARNTGRLAAVSAEVFRLPALGHLVPADRLFVTQFATHSHDRFPSQTRRKRFFSETTEYSDLPGKGNSCPPAAGSFCDPAVSAPHWFQAVTA